MLRGQGGAKRGHRAVKARLVEGDGVHIPLRQDDPARLGLFGDVQGEHVAALVVHGGVRGVEVLGCGVVHHPAAEADDLAPDVDDREHDPIPEAVIDPAVLIAHRQTGVQQVPLVIRGIRHVFIGRFSSVQKVKSSSCYHNGDTKGSAERFGMFGFVLPNLDSLNEEEKQRYRAVYCGVCRSIKDRYGQLSRLTVSFDMTFLALVLGSLYEPSESLGSKRCPIHPTKPQDSHKASLPIMRRT